MDQNNQSLIDFAIGVISHGVKPKGIDYYCDEEPAPRQGYAFRLSKPLIKSFIEISSLSPSLATIRVHNLIEMAMDHLLSLRFSSLSMELEETKEAVPMILEALAQFYGLEPKVLKNSFNDYFRILPDKSENLNDFADNYKKIIKIKDGVDIQDCRPLLRQAVKIIQPTYLDDLELMIEKVRVIVDARYSHNTCSR